MQDSHESFMRVALEAAKSINLAQDVNPQVGAVLVDENNNIVATGFHRGSGTAHAEIDAINKVKSAKGLTLYTTLEPCNATGKTGPCSQAIVAAGIKKVVIGQPDLNLLMTGGADYLTEHGVQVVTAVLDDECANLNESWNFAQNVNRPWVIWKIATSLDGYVAAADGTSKWITSESAREHVQDLRANVGAIITGTGTVIADNPQLTVRKVKLAASPLRVIVGNRKISESAQVFSGPVPAVHISGDIEEVLEKLWVEHGIHKVLIEAGPGLSKSLWAREAIDEVYWYVAPLVLGSGTSAIGDFGISTLNDGFRFSEYLVDRVGLDLLIHFRTN